jgi:signal transduction histidine kinase
MIEIIVKDSGVGIKKEDQSKLFKLFGFLDTT